jgi:hypothetical protein
MYKKNNNNILTINCFINNLLFYIEQRLFLIQLYNKKIKNIYNLNYIKMKSMKLIERLKRVNKR